MKITDEDVRKAIEIYGMILKHEHTDYLCILFEKNAVRKVAEIMIEDGINIEIDLSVTKDEDIAPFLIHNMLNESEAEK